MKTKMIELRKGIGLFIILGYSLLFMAGCEKTPMPVPSGAEQRTSSEIQLAPQPIEKPEMVIKIDHLGNKAVLAPDYSVTVYNDRRVVYEGRKNVGTLGLKEMKLTEEAYANVIYLFEIANFYGINDNILLIPDAPEVFTTYAQKNAMTVSANVDMLVSKTLHDYGTEPEKLVNLRTNAEKMLGIDQFLYPHDGDNDDSDNIGNGK